MMRTTLLGLALGLMGCTGAAPPETPRLRRVAAAPPASTFTQQASERAVSAGAGPAVEIAVRAAVRGDDVGGVVEVPDAACLLAIARGSDDIVDVDLFAYADDGTVLATDEATAKDASILVCPPHPKHVYLSARVAGGHGVVAVVAHPVSPPAIEGVKAAFGLRPGRGVGLSKEPWPALDRHLAERRRELGGSWQSERRVLLLTDPRVPTQASAKIARGTCLDMLAVPSDEVADLDAVVLSDGGRIIARATSDDELRALVVCSPVDTVVTFEFRPHAGRGVVALLLSRSDTPEQVTSDSRHDVAPIGPLAKTVEDHETRLSKQGFDDFVELARGRLGATTRTSVPVRLEQGCSRVDVIVGTPALGFEAWLWDADGDLVSRGAGGAVATLYQCGPKQDGRLDLDATSRGGPFVVQERRLTRTLGPWTELPLAAARLLSRLDAIGLLDDAGAPSTARRLDLAAEHLHREELTVPVGRCVTLAAGVSVGAVGVDIALREASTAQELARGRGPYAASARVCALDVPGTLRVTAEVRVMTGSAAALVASRQTAPEPRR